MPMSASNVYLYAAVPGDYVKCLAAADVCGIPYQNVTGDFTKAWLLVESGNQLVIAVGGAALHALHYNPCGWPNPRGMPAGHTPFEVFSSGCGIDASRAGYFVNAAGYTAIDSLKLAVMLAHYAVHGSFPALWQPRMLWGSTATFARRISSIAPFSWAGAVWLQPAASARDHVRTLRCWRRIQTRTSRVFSVRWMAESGGCHSGP
jgi:hypothetical protein